MRRVSLILVMTVTVGMSITLQANAVAGSMGSAPVLVEARQPVGKNVLVTKHYSDQLGDGSAFSPAMDGDGSTTVFESTAGDLIDGETHEGHQVYAYDRSTGLVTLVSQSFDGADGNGTSQLADVSADGRYVVFSSNSTNLLEDTLPRIMQIFRRDLVTGQTTLVSATADGQPGDLESTNACISGNGNWVAYSSDATNLVPEDISPVTDVYRYDAETGSTTLVTAETHRDALYPFTKAGCLSHDGARLAYELPEPNHRVNDIYVFDATSGTSTLVTHSFGSRKDEHRYSWDAKISADGRFVVYESVARYLVRGDTNGMGDVFRYNVEKDRNGMVSKSPTGAPGDSASEEAAISANGRYVTFSSAADNLAEDPTWRSTDAFMKDMSSGAVTVLSRAADGGPADGNSNRSAIAGDGSHAVFESQATNLVKPRLPRGSTQLFDHRLF